MKFEDTESYVRVMGSRAYGCAAPDSDIDIRGFYVPTISEMIDPLRSKFRTIRSSDYFKDLFLETQKLDVCVHDVSSMFKLWTKGSPEAMELLMEMLEGAGAEEGLMKERHSVPEDAIEVIRTNAQLFVTMNVKSCYHGYINAELKRLKHGKENYEKSKTLKVLSTIVRLSENLRSMLKRGAFSVSGNGDILSKIRNGEVSHDDTMSIIQDNMREISKLSAKSPLPKKPNEQAIREVFYEFSLLAGINDLAGSTF